MVLWIKLTVGFAAGFAYCLIPAGFITSDVVCNHLSTVIADMVVVRVLMVGDYLSTNVANMVFVCVLVIGNYLSAIVANMIFVRILVVGDYLSTNVISAII